MTRRNLKIRVDKSLSHKVSSNRNLPQPDKAGIRINEVFWSDFITVANVLYHLDEETDVYDVFDFIRVWRNGGQKYSKGILARVDAEIEKELGSWTTN